MDSSKEDIRASMGFCQDAIARMAGNSFKLKSWFLVLFSALFTFYAQQPEERISQYGLELIWLIPLLAFPGLDAFYLRHERMFISIFADFGDEFRNRKGNRAAYDLRPNQSQRNEFKLLNVVFSASIGWFYFPLLLTFQTLLCFRAPSLPAWAGAIAPVLTMFLALALRKPTNHNKDSGKEG